jgi:predicted metalloprotease with PDZ domain
VEPGSTGEKAGLKAGDVIIGIGTESVEDEHDVWSALDRFKEGDKAELRILRKGSRQTVALEVKDEMPARAPGLRMRSGHPGSSFHWESEAFNQRMKQLGDRLGRMGRQLEERMKGVGERVREALRHIEV